MIVLRELDGDVLPEGRRADAHVHSYIKHSSTDDPNELSLCVRGELEVQATHHAIAGAALVVLDEVGRSDEIGEALLAEGFEEVAPPITEDARLDDDDLGDRGGDDLQGEVMRVGITSCRLHAVGIARTGS